MQDLPYGGILREMGYAQIVRVPEDGIPVFEPAFGTKLADIKINAKVLDVTLLVHKQCKNASRPCT